MEPIYLDHAADTDVRPAAREAMAAALALVGNPSSGHRHGQRARTVVEQARESLADGLGCRPSEVTFTSGGTESDNLVLKGLAWTHDRRHAVTTAIEHPAVLEPLRWLAGRGEVELTELAPERDGTITVEAVLDALRPDTGLVSVMTANNVTGAVNPIADLGQMLRDRETLLHTDAVQAHLLDVDFAAWNVDAMALSAHKFGGPTGAGVAVVRRALPIEPLHHGGGQDPLRSGTLTAALAAATAAAWAEVVAERKAEKDRLRLLRDTMAGVLGSIDGVDVLGPADAGQQLASHLTVSIDEVAPEVLTFLLDEAGIRASAGSACASGALAGNPVMEAMGVTASASLRLSLGWTSTAEETTRATQIVADVISRARGADASTVPDPVTVPSVVV